MVLDQCMDILVFTGSSLKISVEHLQKYPDIFYGSICIDPVSQLHLLKQRPEAFLIKLVIFSAQGTDLFFQMSGRLKDRLKKKDWHNMGFLQKNAGGQKTDHVCVPARSSPGNRCF